MDIQTTAQGSSDHGTGPAPRPPAREPAPRRRVAPKPSPVTGRVAPSAAAIARPMLVLLPVVTLLVPAIALALMRAPTYTAEARLLVGSFDTRSQSASNAVEASRALAETFARLVETDAIVEPVARALGTTKEAVKGHIGGSSIPESSIIRVQAKAASSRDAIQLADAAAEALSDYASDAGGTSGDERLLDDYEGALLELRQAELELARVNAAGPQVADELVAQAEAAVARFRLRADSLAAEYTARSGGGSGTVRVIGEAIDTGSDRRSTMQFAVGGSVVFGLIAGIALATVVVNRDVTGVRPGRRSAFAPAE